VIGGHNLSEAAAYITSRGFTTPGAWAAVRLDRVSDANLHNLLTPAPANPTVPRRQRGRGR
jgi:hypothetical protein